MKKLLLSAVLGLAAVVVTPALSQAGTFGLFTGCGWCCGGSKCNFTVRPYNAFTPVCSGNITCMGCMPFAPMPNYTGLNPVNFGDQGGYPGVPCGPEGIGQHQVLPGLPTQVLPAQPAQQYAQPQLPAPYTPPAPGLIPTPTTSQAPNPYGINQAGYRPYVPAYTNPYGIYGTTGATPYYWNAK